MGGAGKSGGSIPRTRENGDRCCTATGRGRLFCAYAGVHTVGGAAWTLGGGTGTGNGGGCCCEPAPGTAAAAITGGGLLTMGATGAAGLVGGVQT